MKRTKEEYYNLLEDTVSYYSESPVTKRGMNHSLGGNGCAYYNPNNGNMCAAGRFLLNVEQYARTSNNTESIDFLLQDDIDSPLLKPEARGFSMDFWIKLQDLHDRNKYWTDTGLSEAGIERVKIIKDFIEDLFVESIEN